MNSWKDAVLSGLSSDGLLKVEGFRVDWGNYILSVGLCLKNTYVKLEIKDDGRGSTATSKYCRVIRYDRMECDDKDAFNFPDDCKEVDRFLRVFFISPSLIIGSIKKGLNDFVDWKSDVFSNLGDSGINAEIQTKKREDWECNFSLRFVFGNSQVLTVDVSMNVVGYWVRIKLKFGWNVSGEVFELTKALRIRYPLKQYELLEAISTIKALAKPYAVTPIRRLGSTAWADWCTAVFESLKKEWTVQFNMRDACMEDNETLFVVLVVNGGGVFFDVDVILDVSVEFRITKLSNGGYEYSVLRTTSNMKHVREVADSINGVNMDQIIFGVKLMALDLIHYNSVHERTDFESRICVGLIRAGFWIFTNTETLGFFSDKNEGYFIDQEKNQYKIKFSDLTSFVYSFELNIISGVSKSKVCENLFGAKNFSESVVRYAIELRASCIGKKKIRESSRYTPATLMIFERLTDYLLQFQKEWESSESQQILFDERDRIELRNELKLLLKLIPKGKI